MNERIKQFEKESHIDVYALGKDRVKWEAVLEKFAELIIRDCMHDCLRMQLGNQYTPEELLFQTKYRKIIKEHFGVKNEGFWSKE